MQSQYTAPYDHMEVVIFLSD